VKTSIAGTRLVGRMSVGWCLCLTVTSRLPNISSPGNKNGLLLPNSVTDQGVMCIFISTTIVVEPVPANVYTTELLHMRNSLPDDLIIQRVDERLSGWSTHTLVVSSSWTIPNCPSLT